MSSFMQEEPSLCAPLFCAFHSLAPSMSGVLIAGVLYIVIKKEHLEKVVSQNL